MFLANILTLLLLQLLSFETNADQCFSDIVVPDNYSMLQRPTTASNASSPTEVQDWTQTSARNLWIYVVVDELVRAQSAKYQTHLVRMPPVSYQRFVRGRYCPSSYGFPFAYAIKYVNSYK
jgi:hypothetical protein